ncbi:hypothetical protein RJ640_015473 [Escallonia rubra]|uniref:Ribosomal protein L18e/L15P domain-containing protein n=1 Tax=Escallonia rubra TaxID=112253 RepID=A0AA88US45_9ASTE|nr:hypothetical protein RJ640_015473 [Escallonia rubra]
MHHHRILFDKIHPGYFGKVGMSYFHRLRNKFHCPVVNVEHLWSLVPQEAQEKAAGSGATPVVDVTHRKGVFSYKRGYDEGVGTICRCQLHSPTDSTAKGQAKVTAPQKRNDPARVKSDTRKLRTTVKWGLPLVAIKSATDLMYSSVTSDLAFITSSNAMAMVRQRHRHAVSTSNVVHLRRWRGTNLRRAVISAEPKKKERWAMSSSAMRVPFVSGTSSYSWWVHVTIGGSLARSSSLCHTGGIDGTSAPRAISPTAVKNWTSPVASLIV